ncbi:MULTISPECIES: copper resistance CopC family protein [unclassified Gordonia (in: high G+C Gram-positive bacteria)]|uniref:copper resistance CopC family protein n=1 Tax=unclassified Gordonia (in: high G+C Gram-positive bacteria) TaxID=2657482 RepID=UPI001F0E4372|nr:copper resistance CopC family protein [Gordonia sp. ABSL49_1]MCH5644239.1 copper resistance protein CopC [Gordonia sp. ABSL49_1]
MRDRRIPSLVTLLALCLGVLGFGVVGTLTAPVASAHSKLESMDPADGAKLDRAPAAVTLTFNEGLQRSFAVLNVVGPDGHYWQKGDPVVRGPQISVVVGELGPAGKYTVNYRVTSADGHPVEGSRSFEMTVAGNGTPGPVADTSSGGDGGGFPVVALLIGVGVLLVVGLGVVFWLNRRSSGSSA